MTYSTKALACSFLLCPALYSMQNPHNINWALISAARAHNISAYGQAAHEASIYAEMHPQNIDELLPGIHLNTVTPDFFGHSASLAYGIATNNPVHVAMSSTSALISVLALQQNRTENQATSDLMARFLSFFAFGVPLALTLGEAALTDSWQRVIPAFLSAGIGVIPFIREQLIIEHRNHLTEILNDISVSRNDNANRFRLIMDSFDSLRNTPLIRRTNLRHNLLLQTVPTQLNAPAA